LKIPLILSKGIRSFHSLKIKGPREYAVTYGLKENEALTVGMEDKSREFVEKGAEVYAKA